MKGKKTRGRKAPGSRAGQEDQEPKLSEIIYDMALSLLKNRAAGCSPQAAQTGIMLASCAWNAAIGERGLLERLPELLGQIDCSEGEPWPELVSRDTDRLIAELMAYKQARHPGDRRRIRDILIDPECQLKITWEPSPNVLAGPFGQRASRPAKPGRPIAQKLLAQMKRATRHSSLDLGKVRSANAAAAKLREEFSSKADLDRLHPLHAAYVLAQNQASLLSEMLVPLPEMKPFARLLERAEDLYMPSGPPMSPITLSFFANWALFDLGAGPARETIGTTILELGGTLGMDPELLRLIGLLQESRMGIHVVEGSGKAHVQLRELVTDRVCQAIVPGGYRGRMGDLWYVRVLPPPIRGYTEHLVFTTPYILAHPGLPAWEAYFRRTLPDAPSQARLEAYEHHLKSGPDPWYWTEFVFEAYVNHSPESILLAGLPDIPESRPHSAVNSGRDDS